MMRNYVIPYLKKKMDTSDEIAATLDEQGITQFDSIYVPNEAIKLANSRIKNVILSGQLANNIDTMAIENELRKDLSRQGTQRFLKPSDIPDKTWKDIFKDLEWEVDFEVTNETIDKEQMFTTLTTVLQTVASNPAILSDPNMRMLFNTILEETGRISPLQLSQVSAQPQAPPQPAPGQTPPMEGMTGTETKPNPNFNPNKPNPKK